MDDDRNGKDKASAKMKCTPCACSGPCFLTNVLKYQLPLMLGTAIVIGYLVPAPGVWISKQGVPLGPTFVARIASTVAEACARVRVCSLSRNRPPPASMHSSQFAPPHSCNHSSPFPCARAGEG